MEKPIICENVTVYDFRAHQRFNMLMCALSQWIMYAITMLLGAAMVIVYFYMKAPIVLIIGIFVLIVINLMKFWFQPSAIRKSYGQILSIRGEMVFSYRFHEDSFDQLCQSKKGEHGIEADYDLMKKIIETKEEFLFVTKQNTAYYVRKNPDLEYETNKLSECLQKYKQYRYVGRKPKKSIEANSDAGDKE